MTNLHDSLPDLMRRATEDLQPATPELVARGIRRGKVLRRRRTALAGLSGATAVLATLGVVIGSSQVLRAQVEPATTPTITPTVTTVVTPKPTVSQPVTPAETLATLTRLLPNGLTPIASTKSGGYGLGTNEASVLLDDGAGASLLTLSITTAAAITDCNPFPPGTCTIHADRSVHVVYDNQPLYPDRPTPGGVRETIVELFRPNGTQISLTNFNAPKEKSEHTRTSPLLTAAQLAEIARSPHWVFPPRQATPGAQRCTSVCSKE
ncbi:hypothetical protein [Kribbella sindirgiensis]|uniref:Uncharacterized protein n=1 Tax=Kribbella sindirgiensis TaxID=1124744 RepID=A0A4V2M465_9ACTN|nr:hypothetical protein [Kribbella sindirgiensis]TCC34692.1 hypothetical protein E0H50_12305 [Kribbella sindirgiensis]